MNNLKCRMQKLNRTLYCKKLKSDINISQCNNCKYKEYKTTDKVVRLKVKTYKLAKMEHNRKSILTEDLEHCIICGSKKDALHEVFFGSNRLNSIKYGIVIPLCHKHHSEMHINKNWQNYWHKKGQVAFNKAYPDLDFVKIFKRNYL